MRYIIEAKEIWGEMFANIKEVVPDDKALVRLRELGQELKDKGCMVSDPYCTNSPFEDALITYTCEGEHGILSIQSICA